MEKLFENGVPNNPDEVQKAFAEHAKDLMNNYLIDGKYELTEIEYYLYDENHPDPFSHGPIKERAELQKNFGKTYIHNEFSKKSTSTRNGVDITFGNNIFYGGILIRGIKKIENHKFIYGPCICLRELFNEDIITNGDDFPLTKSKTNNTEIFSGPRKGLTLGKKSGNQSEKNIFLMKDYRFYKYPKKKHDDKGLLVIASSINSHNYKHIDKYNNDLKFGKLDKFFKNIFGYNVKYEDIFNDRQIQAFNSFKENNIVLNNIERKKWFYIYSYFK